MNGHFSGTLTRGSSSGHHAAGQRAAPIAAELCAEGLWIYRAQVWQYDIMVNQ
ncbi:hypothetical protein K0T92_00155 [Paenibacillus oenotherae]|uniref:Uncharacterized protein n=1 Tax=Paenibacillus oenotherae TaxID=1435645 RepID=A0ABS7CZU6_9BACL|nr:hypothetical protein [Paenibacillus oenotherae]MBW7473147.1 hypothetical protein [Paenibacillus oenotherae]